MTARVCRHGTSATACGVPACALAEAYAQAADARAEAERLRGLLDRLTRSIAGHCDVDHGGFDCLLGLAEATRREAGLA